MRSYGVSIESAFSSMRQHMSKLNEVNFKDGVEGLARMASKATALRIDMGETLRFANNVMNPEKAIEMANAFQRLGAGTSALLDPLKLMDMSMNDPEQLQNELVKMTQQYVSFNKETNQFNITNKRMFRELADSLGMSYEQLTKMAIGSADLNKKLSEITFPDTFSKEQKEMIANMSEMKGGQYVVTVMEDGQMKEKKVTELSDKNLEFLQKQPKTMEEVQKQSLTTTQSMAQDIAAIRARVTGGVARSNTVQQTALGARGLTSTLEKFLGDR
jgi:hypothetical protein